MIKERYPPDSSPGGPKAVENDTKDVQEGCGVARAVSFVPFIAKTYLGAINGQNAL